MSNPRSIFLVGLMGAGKSTVGPRLAARLGRDFVDTDHEIELRTGRTIAEIFAVEGEPRFRELERDAIESAAQAAAVVALGGGAIAQPGALERLRTRGLLVYLDAPIDCLLERIGAAEGRPLLAGLDAAGRADRLAKLLEAREPWYAAADHRVDASGSPDEVVERLVSLLMDAGAA